MHQVPVADLTRALRARPPEVARLNKNKGEEVAWRGEEKEEKETEKRFDQEEWSRGREKVQKGERRRVEVGRRGRDCRYLITY